MNYALENLKLFGFTAVDIPLTKEKWSTIDIDDAPVVLQYRWHARGQKHFYAQRAKRINGKSVAIHLHRLLMSTPKGMETDHADRNGLNNRRSNLRICTKVQNLSNQSRITGNATGFVGVSVTPSGKFDAKIAYKTKRICLGKFTTPEDAARAYDSAAVILKGEFALTNEMLGNYNNARG